MLIIVRDNTKNFICILCRIRLLLVSKIFVRDCSDPNDLNKILFRRSGFTDLWIGKIFSKYVDALILYVTYVNYGIARESLAECFKNSNLESYEC